MQPESRDNTRGAAANPRGCRRNYPIIVRTPSASYISVLKRRGTIGQTFAGRSRIRDPMTRDNSLQTRDALDQDRHVNDAIDQQLKLLEQRVDALISRCVQLQAENDMLRQSQDTLTTERAQLVEKNEQARARVEAMISRLRAMEQG